MPEESHCPAPMDATGQIHLVVVDLVLDLIQNRQWVSASELWMQMDEQYVSSCFIYQLDWIKRLDVSNSKCYF